MTTTTGFDNSDDVIIDPATISAVPGCIRGMTESQYLLGAIVGVQRELESAQLRSDAVRVVDIMERIDSLKNCLVTALLKGE